MKKICIIDSTYPINTRTNKILNSLRTAFGEENLFVIAWNRDGRNSPEMEKNFYIYKRNSAYGNKLKKLCNLFAFKKYISDIYEKEDFDFIIASHWETLLITSEIKHSHTKLIYENLDIPTSTNKIILKLLQIVEKKALRKTDAICFASRFFVPLYNFYLNEKILLENKPDKEIMITTVKEQNAFNVVFLGVIRYFDILKNLIDAVKECPEISLTIWGDGPDYNKTYDYAKNISNIFIKGRYDNSQLSDIYASADLVWAVYPNKDYNVKYAISNKFHESIDTGKPCIYANKTELGNYVLSNKIGYVVDPYSVEDIKASLRKIKRNPNLNNEIIENLSLFKKKRITWNEEVKNLINYISK